MKTFKTIIILLSFFTLNIQAQDTIFYNKEHQKVNSMVLAATYRVILNDPSDSNSRTEKLYTRAGIIKSEVRKIKIFAQNDEKNFTWKNQGKYTDWYENGQVFKNEEYVYGKREGISIMYWKNGILKRKENYVDGKFVNGNCYDSIGNEITFFQYEIMPKFPGGESALLEFISRNLRYPVEMQMQAIQGKVILRFVVSSTGNVTNIQVLRGIAPQLDQEAIRVINALPKWIPGMQDGVNVPVFYTLPITFKLQ